MSRRAWALGFFATGTQILLLRGLVTSLHGAELFVGVALFGWLIWGATGALLAKLGVVPVRLAFAGGSIALPLLGAAVRLAPLAAVGTPGEYVPLWLSLLLSVLTMLPCALISGLLFTRLASEGEEAARSAVTVYVLEGCGAFVAGAAVVLSSGWLSWFSCALVIGTVTAVVALPSHIRPLPGRIAPLLVAGLVGLLASVVVGPHLDAAIDGLKYAGYEVEASFDTRYGHQTLLSREGTRILMTDNRVEAVWPDIEAAEEVLFAPLLVVPNAERMLYVGRGAFHAAAVDGRSPVENLYWLDNRRGLDRLEDSLFRGRRVGVRLTADVAGYLARAVPERFLDVVVVDLPNLTSYQSARVLTTNVLRNVRRHLGPNGLLWVNLEIDSERYISDASALLIRSVYGSLASVFAHVTVWPGTRTAFLASAADMVDPSTATLITRLEQQSSGKNLYLTPDRLADRLNEFRRERIIETARVPGQVNTLSRPVLPALALQSGASLNAVDGLLASLVAPSARWAFVTLLFVVTLFMLASRRKAGRSRFSLFIFFVAGFVSLSAEMLSFYVLQSTAGVLYYGLAILVGCFMAGLSLGAWIAFGVDHRRVELLSFATLALAIGAFVLTYGRVPTALGLWYHGFFLTVVSLSTGALFAAATDRRHTREAGEHRGLGYSMELLGSAVGALLVLPMLLPVTGLTGLLAGLIGVVVLGCVGSLAIRR